MTIVKERIFFAIGKLEKLNIYSSIEYLMSIL